MNILFWEYNQRSSYLKIGKNIWTIVVSLKKKSTYYVSFTMIFCLNYFLCEATFFVEECSNFYTFSMDSIFPDWISEGQHLCLLILACVKRTNLFRILVNRSQLVIDFVNNLIKYESCSKLFLQLVLRPFFVSIKKNAFK